MSESRLPRHSDLAEAEVLVASQSDADLPGAVEHFPPIVDTFYALSYRTNLDENAQPPWDEFQALARGYYNQLPRTFWVCRMAARNGNYLESNIIFRSLLERFVVLKYFLANDARFLQHQRATSFRNRVSFYDMFEAFSPGFYSVYYSLYSVFSHGGPGQAVFSLQELPDGRRFEEPLPSYSRDFYSMCLNQLTMLAAGYLWHFADFFPDNNLSDHPDEQSLYKVVLRSVEGGVAQLAEVQSSSSWQQGMAQLVSHDAV
jgi:hypothetical protein